MMCGTISPTKAISPVKATAKDTAKEETMRSLIFNFLALTPKFLASSSPLKRIFSSFLCA